MQPLNVQRNSVATRQTGTLCFLIIVITHAYVNLAGEWSNQLIISCVELFIFEISPHCIILSEAV